MYGGSATNGILVECEIPAAELSPLPNRLGKGGFGTVDCYLWKGDEVCAVKTLKAEGSSVPSFALPAFCREINVLNKQLRRHPNIVRVYGACMLECGRLALVEEMASRSLRDLLHSNGGNEGLPMALADALHIAVQLARGVQHVHSSGLVHNDLKSLNVLLFERLDGTPVVAKLADFGLVRRVRVASSADSLPDFSSTPAGLPLCTPRWSAPENHEPVDSAASGQPPSDIYSLGMVIYECVSGLYPFFPQFQGHRDNEIPAHVKAGGRPALPAGLHSELAAIIQSCWAQNPRDRPVAEELLGSLISLQRRVLANPTATAVAAAAATAAAATTAVVDTSAAAAAAAAPVAAAKAHPQPSPSASAWCCFGGATVGEPPKPLPAPISPATGTPAQAASSASPPASEAAAVSARTAEPSEPAASLASPEATPHLRLVSVTGAASPSPSLTPTPTSTSTSAPPPAEGSAPPPDSGLEEALARMLGMSAAEVVAQLGAEPGSVRLAERGLEVLRSLALGKEGQLECLAAGAPKAIVAALAAHSAASAAVCLEALWALRRLAATREGASACFRADAFPLSIRVLEAHTRARTASVCEQASMLMYCLESGGALTGILGSSPKTAQALLALLTRVLQAFPTNEPEACTGASAAIGALAPMLPEGAYEEAAAALKAAQAGHDYPRLRTAVGCALAQLEARAPPPPAPPLQPEGRLVDCGPEPASWTVAVEEGGSFTVRHSPVSVRYGDGGRWLVQHGLTGRVEATNAFFGVGFMRNADPAYGVLKHCEVGTRWVEVAVEGERVHFPVRRTVRYGLELTEGLGLRSSWVEMSVQGAVEVSNDYFGKDPWVLRTKVLQVRMEALWAKD